MVKPLLIVSYSFPNHHIDMFLDLLHLYNVEHSDWGRPLPQSPWRRWKGLSWTPLRARSLLTPWSKSSSLLTSLGRSRTLTWFHPQFLLLILGLRTSLKTRRGWKSISICCRRSFLHNQWPPLLGPDFLRLCLLRLFTAFVARPLARAVLPRLLRPPMWTALNRVSPWARSEVSFLLLYFYILLLISSIPRAGSLRIIRVEG